MLIDDDKIYPSTKTKPPAHYYGDIVRQLFIAASIIMVATMAYFAELITLPPSLSVVAIIVLVLLSGLESPNNKKIVTVNMVAAALGFCFFQYYTVNYYLANVATSSIRWSFFVVNQVLALIFFAAFYYSSKTVRAWKQIELKR